MRVLNVNKFHYRRGGAETVYFDLARLLAERGHEVVPFAMQHPRNESTPWSRHFPSFVDFRAPAPAARRLAMAARVVYSREARRCLRRLLAEARPDLAHLHNIAHQLSPSILDALREADVPVVQTLHDYKLTCPVYTHRTPRGEVCERCKGGRYHHCVLRRCNAGNAGMSATNAVEMAWHRWRRTYDAVDVFICPSRFLFAKCLEFGMERERLAVVPNFVFPRDLEPSGPRPDGHALYAGRLAAEKGLVTLLEAHARVPASRLVLAGEGPLRPALEARARALGVGARTRFAGHLTGSDYEAAWRDAAFLVLPSEWYEVQPMVIGEAQWRGKPVLTTRIGGIPEQVAHGETGWLVPPADADSLAAGLGELLRSPERLAAMGRAARARAEVEWTADRHWAELEDVYRRAVGRGRRAAA